MCIGQCTLLQAFSSYRAYSPLPGAGLNSPDHAAPDLFTGIPGRLRGKVIPLCMDDHRTAEDIRDKEPPVVKRGPGISLVSHQRQQVACMVGMRLHGRIIMRPRPGKVLGTVAMFVDVERIKAGGSRDRDIREPEDLRLHQDTAIRGGIKFYQTAQLGRGTVSGHPGHSLRPIII